MNKRTKTNIVSIIIALIILLITLIFSYFIYKNFNSIDTEKVKIAKTNKPALLEDESSILLNITEDMIIRNDKDKNYWGSINGVRSDEKTNIVIGKINTEASCKIECYYTITITNTGSLFYTYKNWDNRKNDQLVLTIQNDDTIQLYDFNDDTLEFPITYQGVLTNVTKNSKNIVANLKFKNSASLDERIFLNNNISINFSFSNFECN